MTCAGSNVLPQTRTDYQQDKWKSAGSPIKIRDRCDFRMYSPGGNAHHNGSLLLGARGDQEEAAENVMGFSLTLPNRRFSDQLTRRAEMFATSCLPVELRKINPRVNTSCAGTVAFCPLLPVPSWGTASGLETAIKAVLQTIASIKSDSRSIENDWRLSATRRSAGLTYVQLLPLYSIACTGSVSVLAIWSQACIFGNSCEVGI